MTKTATTGFFALYCIQLLNNSSGVEFLSGHSHEYIQFAVRAPQSTRELLDSCVQKVIVGEVQDFQLGGGWADKRGQVIGAELCQAAALQSKQTENTDSVKNVFIWLGEENRKLYWGMTWVSPVCCSSVHQRAILFLHLSGCCYPGPALWPGMSWCNWPGFHSSSQWDYTHLDCRRKDIMRKVNNVIKKFPLLLRLDILHSILPCLE